MAPLRDERDECSEDEADPALQRIEDFLLVRKRTPLSKAVIIVLDAEGSDEQSDIPFLPRSILRESRYLSTTNSIGSSKEEVVTMPSHWPSTGGNPTVASPLTCTLTSVKESIKRSFSCRQTHSNVNVANVRFANPLLTSTSYRPKTHVIDIPRLYYSVADVKKFKRDYRQLIRAQTLARKQLASGNNDVVVEERPLKQLKQHADNSFWRSKVGRRWGATSSMSASQQQQQTEQDNNNIDNNSVDGGSYLDPLNDGTSFVEVDLGSRNKDNTDEIEAAVSEDPTITPDSDRGIFSSVYDYVAQYNPVVVSGTSSSQPSSMCNNKANQEQVTSLHLVDTLYLF